ncbi:hypothetical protein HGRIS_010313 [Hohenbuehelia grisea]|uniref:Uncharacterized protein n=1 Tax=Hohenbuehelia grisea TaxID=104357 RepID=A0ABR3J3Y3_9AGAR
MASVAVALITGAGQGFGRAISIRLAKDGFNVALNDLSSNAAQLKAVQNEVAAVGREAVIVPADVTSETEVMKMVDDTVRKLGTLDVMVANAGLAWATPVLEANAMDWDKIFDVNGRGTFLCYKYAAKQMVAQGQGGRIIGACSRSGKQGTVERTFNLRQSQDDPT